MDRKVRVVQYGTGKMSVYTMRYVFEKGGEIVGAIDVNPSVIGKDIGEIIGGEKRGVPVTDAKDAETLLKELKPDIVIVTTMSLLNDIKDAFMLCAKLGINAISTCEEAFFPFNSNTTVTDEIDKLAKEKGMHELYAQIYSFNAQSQRMFESAGFKRVEEEKFVFIL